MAYSCGGEQMLPCLIMMTSRQSPTKVFFWYIVHVLVPFLNRKQIYYDPQIYLRHMYKSSFMLNQAFLTFCFVVFHTFLKMLDVLLFGRAFIPESCTPLTKFLFTISSEYHTDGGALNSFQKTGSSKFFYLKKHFTFSYYVDFHDGNLYFLKIQGITKQVKNLNWFFMKKLKFWELKCIFINIFSDLFMNAMKIPAFIIAKH